MTDEQIALTLRNQRPRNASPGLKATTLRRFEALQRRRRDRPRRVAAGVTLVFALLLGIGGKVAHDRQIRLDTARLQAQRIEGQRAALQRAAPQSAGSLRGEQHTATLSAVPPGHEAIRSEGDATPRAAVDGHDADRGTVRNLATSQPRNGETVRNLATSQPRNPATVLTDDARRAALLAEWKNLDTAAQRLDTEANHAPHAPVGNARIHLVTGVPAQPKQPASPSQTPGPPKPVMY